MIAFAAIIVATAAAVVVVSVVSWLLFLRRKRYKIFIFYTHSNVHINKISKMEWVCCACYDLMLWFIQRKALEHTHTLKNEEKNKNKLLLIQPNKSSKKNIATESEQ